MTSGAKDPPVDVSYDNTVMDMENDRDGVASGHEATQPPCTEEIIVYIKDMMAELALLAQKSNLDVVAYLLDMARVEADVVLKGKNTRLPEGG